MRLIFSRKTKSGDCDNDDKTGQNGVMVDGMSECEDVCGHGRN